jgi:glycosyltransferase involved in cell wall biosynthesis
MKISVAMCTYYGEKYVKEQLESILNQTHNIDEIIICDDCSKDETLNICKEILKESNVSFKIKSNENNLGFIKNFYQALDLCTGDIIFFSDQDDVWKKDKVEKVLDVFKNNKDALLVFTEADVVNQDLVGEDSLLKGASFKNEFLKSNQTKFNSLLNDNYVTGATMAIKKELKSELEKASRFNDCPHDYWLALIAAANNGLYCYEKPLIYYRQHSSNTIGINKRYSFKQVKKLFSSNRNKNRENRYAELRLPTLYELKKYVLLKNNKEYLKIINNKIKFWENRSDFFGGSFTKNIMVVFKSTINGEQKLNRNVNHPILVDFVKACALSKKI